MQSPTCLMFTRLPRPNMAGPLPRPAKRSIFQRFPIERFDNDVHI
ncbi:hypothetical protein Thimo_1189 [Thioflavicoccus mobilis 8321]|uniref:Uncharacterized protein n=1 Tax=Thioflavicoccus mobilis 8321 TaxID=765912 RepID=L0GTB6_9GAMM|nr:hypothetical protein Thimo_1189 [Thioflavicoccus mobilis 8321]